MIRGVTSATEEGAAKAGAASWFPTNRAVVLDPAAWARLVAERELDEALRGGVKGTSLDPGSAR